MISFLIALSVLLVVAVVSLTMAMLQARQRCASLEAEIGRFRTEAAQRDSDLLQRNEMDSVKDEFISTVSHELRTPLTSIRGALGLLSAGLMGKVDDKAANLLRIASTNTDRLVRLINDILDLERMSSGSAPLQPRPCSMRDLVLQSIDTMTAMAENAKVHLLAVTEAGNPALIVQADPDRIQQVLTNLLSNAIKFSPVGSTIRMTMETRPGELTVRVVDHGRGVPAAKLESIFERFQQVEAADSRQKGGTGLGLAICRSIIQQHGGQIWAERNDTDTPGEPGSTFAVRLPRVEVQANPPGTPRQGSVLMDETDTVGRHEIAEHVRNQGLRALEAGSGAVTLEDAASQPTDAALSDHRTPSLPACDLLMRPRANFVAAAIPIPVLSVPPSVMRDGGPSSVMSKAPGWLLRPHNPGALLAGLGSVPRHGAEPTRLLLVGTDPDLAAAALSSLHDSLARTDLLVDCARSLFEAVVLCETRAPGVLIADLSLPKRASFAFVQWLRSHPRLQTIPLLVYSGRRVTAEGVHQLRPISEQSSRKVRVQPKEIEELVAAVVQPRQIHTAKGFAA